jgi:hypothetical protein
VLQACVKVVHMCRVENARQVIVAIHKSLPLPLRICSLNSLFKPLKPCLSWVFASHSGAFELLQIPSLHETQFVLCSAIYSTILTMSVNHYRACV